MDLETLERKQKVVFVAGMHGNERMPVKALTEAGLEFILGSPLAYEKNVRFTKNDLNASFGVTDDSYESKRAGEILTQIDQDALVVDFHSTRAYFQKWAVLGFN